MEPPADTFIPAEHQGVLILARLIPCCQHFVEPKERAKKKSWHHRQAELKALLRQPRLPSAAHTAQHDTPLLVPSTAEVLSPFESSMDLFAATHQITTLKRDEFVRYLLSSPCNVAMRASYLHGNPDGDNWPLALGAAISEATSATCLPAAGRGTLAKPISWELLLCLMRNVLCHEHCFDFSNVRKMWNEALRCFGSVSIIEEILTIYSMYVEERAGATFSAYKQHFPPEMLLHSLQLFTECSSSAPEKPHWKELLLFLQLVICRCNNAIVDARFESEMEEMAERELNIESDEWTAFALYLLSHPANPDQNGTNPDEVSWLMALRLMRNIVCHERSFSFAFTAELISVSLRLFRTTANFERIIGLYRSCCFTSLPALLASESSSASATARRRASALVRLQPVASLQLQNPASCALLLSPHLKLAQIVLGADTLCRWAKTIKETSGSKDACVTALVGEHRSGRTTAALFIAAVMSCAAGVPSFGTARRRRSTAPELRVSSGTVLYVRLLRALDWRSTPVASIVAKLESLIAAAATEQAGADLASLIERSQASDSQVVVICDDIDSIFAACTSPEQAQELRLALASFFVSLQPAVSFVVTTASTFIDATVRGDWPFVRSFPLNALAARESLVSDAQLLIRHYYQIDKWQLRTMCAASVSPIALLGLVRHAV